MTEEKWSTDYAESQATTDRKTCPPSADLAMLAAGDFPGSRKEALLRHVERCSDCSSEVAMAMEGQQMFADEVSVARESRFWTMPPSVALAATLALGIGIGLVLSRVAGEDARPAAHPNVVIADLLPTDNQLRGASETEVIVPTDASWFTLVLASSVVPEFPTYRAEFTTEGRTVVVDGLTHAPFEPFTVGLATNNLPAGAYVVRLSGVAGQGPQELGRYRFTLRYE